MIELRVNGETVELDDDVDESTPLLWVLRDNLGLTGTKYGCGMGECGSCTVHIDGVAERSCLKRIRSLKDSEIVTIEGLSADGSHPVQEAWKEHAVPQCGYCQVGQIMQAAALLDDNPSPTDEEIDDEMKGNLCRCGTYVRIRAAIHSAAEASVK